MGSLREGKTQSGAIEARWSPDSLSSSSSLRVPKFSGASEADVRAACAQTAFEAGRWFDFPEGSWGRTPQIIDNLVEREILLRQKFE